MYKERDSLLTQVTHLCHVRRIICVFDLSHTATVQSETEWWITDLDISPILVIWILFCLIIIFVHVFSKFPLHLECYLLSPKMHKKVSKKIKQNKRYISITKKNDTYITLSDLSCFVSDLTVADTPFRGVVLCGKETRSYVCHLGAPLGWLPNVCIKVIKVILVCLFVL